MRVLVTAVFCGALVGVGAGVSQAYLGEEPGADANVGHPSDFGQPVSERGRGLTPEDAARAVAERLRESNLRTAEFRASDLGVQMLALTVDGGGTPEADVEQRWLASLARGAIAEEMRTTESTTAEVVPDAYLISEDGSTLALGTGSVAAGQTYESISDAEIMDVARTAGAQFGLRLVATTTWRPLGTALHVTYAVDDARGSGKFMVDELRNSLQGSPLRFEGLLISLESGGKVVARVGNSYRTGSSDVWFAEGWDAKAGIVHSGFEPNLLQAN